MYYAKEGSYYVLKIEDGENLFDVLEKFVKAEHVSSGVILAGIGMLKDFELGYFDGKEYHRKKYSAPHELVSMKGTVADSLPHIHAALANEKHELLGGHLFSATTCILNEIFIQKLEKINLGRVKNQKTGLMELVIHQ
ncbi:MAG: DUF296 domain-containing protein [Thermoplasmata archaeon]|nr:DUF296 domain-containing protein [Thermoplasmata archaeon]